MELNIEINGYQDRDLEHALDEVKRLVSEGFRTGWNKNETGSFRFSVEGDEIESFFVAPPDLDEDDADTEDYEQYSRYEEAQEETGENDTVFGVMSQGGITRLD